MNTGTKILFVICAITIIAGVAIYFEASAYQKKAKITIGTVVNSGISTYEIKYTSDDGVERTYQGRHSSKGRKRRDGESVKVFYLIDNPDKCRISDGKKGGKKVVFWGFILLLFNLYAVYSNTKKARTSNSFKTTGRKVEAQILRTDFDTEHSVFKKIPYFIDISWTDPITGKVYNHTIRYVWEDPRTLLAGRKTIDVYIDRNDPEKYFMDIEFLGPAAK